MAYGLLEKTFVSSDLIPGKGKAIDERVSFLRCDLTGFLIGVFVARIQYGTNKDRGPGQVAIISSN